MVSFILALVILFFGFAVYGRLNEKIFAPDDRKTPAVELNDGVDYMPIKKWKAVLIQLLNMPEQDLFSVLLWVPASDR